MLQNREKLLRSEKLNELAKGVLALPLDHRYSQLEVDQETKAAIEKLKKETGK